MAVYVDSFFARFGRMRMCHMVTDTRAELDAMADQIGLKRQWIQSEGTHREHYDVGVGLREKAIAAGAKVVTMRGLVTILNAKRKAVTP